MQGKRTARSSALSYLEGYIDPNEMERGPFGDHTGYYNEVEFPGLYRGDNDNTEKPHLSQHLHSDRQMSHAILGVALNEFLCHFSEAVPEIVDFYLPPEGCSYRMAVVGIRKEYPGHETYYVGHLEFSPSVVHQIHCYHRQTSMFKLGGCDLGHDNADGSASRLCFYR